jgi:hypothetical protein
MEALPPSSVTTLSLGPSVVNGDSDGLGAVVLGSTNDSFGELSMTVFCCGPGEFVVGASVVVGATGALSEFGISETPVTKLFAPCVTAPGSAASASRIFSGGVNNENVVGTPGFRFCRSV